MIKKISIALLTILSISVSIYLYALNITFDEAKYGTSEVTIFSIPFTMVIVNSNFFILSKILKKQDFYSRFKKGLDSIFLSLSIILFLLHCGLLLKTTGTEINLHLFIPISVGIVLITTANTLPRFQLELDENSPQTKSTNQIWNIVIRPFSLPLFIGGSVMLFCVFLPGITMFIGFFTILLCTLLVSIFRSYKAYQSHLNNLKN
jgi:small neutral amino acid transporter SnatA (MarC family)